MRKILIAILTMLALLIMFTACTGNPEKQPENTDKKNITTTTAKVDEKTPVSEITVNPSTDGYIFTHNDYDVVLGIPADELLNALGEPLGTFADESCAFRGIDYIYQYLGVQYNTFSTNENGDNYILSVTFMDDTVTTAEGAYIGMTQSEIENIYGTPTESNDARIKYIKDGMSLSFVFNNDIVADITYYYDIAKEFEVIG